MRKKVVAVLSALTIVAMSSMTAFAASPTAGTTEAPVSTQTAVTTVEVTATPADFAAVTVAPEGFKVAPVTETIVKSAAVAVQNEVLNDLESIGAVLGNSTIAEAAKDPTKKVTASVLSVVEVDPTTASKNERGNYVVTLSLPTITVGDAIAVLHYNGAAWEKIVPSSVERGAVTFETASLSPISIVKLEVATVTASPKTGEAVPYALFIPAVGFVGAAFCGKKYFA